MDGATPLRPTVSELSLLAKLRTHNPTTNNVAHASHVSVKIPMQHGKYALDSQSTSKLCRHTNEPHHRSLTLSMTMASY